MGTRPTLEYDCPRETRGSCEALLQSPSLIGSVAQIGSLEGGSPSVCCLFRFDDRISGLRNFLECGSVSCRFVHHKGGSLTALLSRQDSRSM